MSEKYICYNCFRERPDLQENPEAKDPCPYCGFDLEENVKKFPVALRAGTILNNRYIVGRVLGQGGFGITYLAYDTKLAAKVAVKEFMPNDIATRQGTTVSVAVESRSEDFAYGAERCKEEALDVMIPVLPACTRPSPATCRRSPWSGWTRTPWFRRPRRGRRYRSTWSGRS